jgi:hypothetical protein
MVPLMPEIDVISVIKHFQANVNDFHGISQPGIKKIEIRPASHFLTLVFFVFLQKPPDEWIGLFNLLNGRTF